MERATRRREQHRRRRSRRSASAAAEPHVGRPATTRADRACRDGAARGRCRRRRRSRDRDRRTSPARGPRRRAITPRSCVMKTTAEPVRTCTSLISSRICAWIVTSSAVVGSSAMITSGSFAIIIAIIARWRIPPENSCGYWRTRTSGRGIPTDSSSSTARSIASCSLMSPRCAADRLGDLLADRGAPGLSAVSGSWKIMPILAPRIVCRNCDLRPISSSPWNLAEPVIVAVRGSRPEQREHRHRLARARLADDAEHLARGHVEVDAPHRVHRSVLGAERHAEAADLQDGLAAAPVRRIDVRDVRVFHRISVTSSA